MLSLFTRVLHKRMECCALMNGGIVGSDTVEITIDAEAILEASDALT